MPMPVTITPDTDEYRQPVLDVSLRAWEPIFPQTRDAVPGFVYESFYPDGWRTRQFG